MAGRTNALRPLLVAGAVYWADNGRAICRSCAGASSLYTGHDISGQRVERVSVDDVRNWPADLGPMRCEAGCTTLAPVGDGAGWPFARPVERAGGGAR